MNLVESLQSKPDANDTMLTESNLKAITVKGAKDYDTKWIDKSMVSGKRLYKHLVSTDISDMFIQLSVASSINGIQTETSNHVKVMVPILKPQDCIIWDVTFHSYGKGKHDSLIGKWDAIVYRRLKFQVRYNADKTIEFIRYDSNDLITTPTPAQSQLLHSFGSDVLLKHIASNITSFMNIISNGGKFPTLHNVFKKPSNKVYNAFKRQ